MQKCQGVSSVRCVWHWYDIPNEVSILPICAPFTSLNNSFTNKAKRKLNNEIDLILKIEELTSQLIVESSN